MRSGHGLIQGWGFPGWRSYDALLDAESLADGRQTVSANEGILAVFARQIIHGRYESGFSEQLLSSEVQPVVYGPTTFSFNGGLMSDLKMQDYGTLVILGDFGPESAISVKNIHDQRGDAFSAAGSMASQAALLLNVQNILLGEEVYLAPALLDPQPKHLAAAQRGRSAAGWPDPGVSNRRDAESGGCAVKKLLFAAITLLVGLTVLAGFFYQDELGPTLTPDLRLGTDAGGRGRADRDGLSGRFPHS